jgi:hypothetical protein
MGWLYIGILLALVFAVGFLIGERSGVHRLFKGTKEPK